MSVLRDAIRTLDPAPDKTKDITLLLNLLSELCEQKVAAFSEAIETEIRTAGTVENRTVPATEILAIHKEYRAYVEDDASKIATEVSSAIKKFVAGGAESIIDGVASLVTTGIEALIGAGSGTQQEMESYYIIVQGFALVRFDIRVWCRHIEASGITTQIQQALAFAAYKSSVDVRRITLNTFLIAYQNQLAVIGIQESDWQNYLDTAEALFNRLKSDNIDITSVGAVAGPAAMDSRVGFHPPGRFRGSLWSNGLRE